MTDRVINIGSGISTNFETKLLIVFSGETQVVSLESEYASSSNRLAILVFKGYANDSSLIPNIHDALIPLAIMAFTGVVILLEKLNQSFGQLLVKTQLLIPDFSNPHPVAFNPI